MALQYRLGSNTYDQDFDFVETYVQFANGTISEDGFKSLRHGYISALYKYKDKLNDFLGTYQGKLPNWMLSDYATYKTQSEYTKERLKEIRVVIMKDMPPYNWESYNQKVYEEYEDEYYRRVRAFEDEYTRRTQMLYFDYPRYVNQVILTKYNDNTAKIISEEIDEIEKEFIIERVQKLILFISSVFCLKQNPEKMLINPPKSISTQPVLFGKSICYLVNDTGLFGFGTWLYAYCNGVDLVGFPNQYMEFDFDGMSCPLIFAAHDFNHINLIKRKKIKDNILTIDLYHKILEDTETTQLQKELLILSLWIQTHEIDSSGDVGSTLDFFDDSADISYFEQYLTPINLHEEFSRFRSLILDPKLLALFKQDIVDRTSKNKDRTRETYTSQITPNYDNVDEYSKLADNEDLIRERLKKNNLYANPQNLEIGVENCKIALLQNLVLFYYRQMCKKFYLSDYLPN